MFDQFRAPALLRKQNSHRRGVSLRLEQLDDRIVPTVSATATINADPLTGGIGIVDDAVRGVNIGVGDDRPSLADPISLQRAKEAGVRLYRIPGGTYSDVIHFDMQDPNGAAGWNYFKSNWMDSMKFAEAAGGRKMVTLNYGTGSPQEAAAWVAYLNGTNISDTTAIGRGQYWTIKPGKDMLSKDPADRDVVWKDWKTVGFWAGLRGQSPLATDDGLNFLRVAHPQPFGAEYMEVGNEVYGGWEPAVRVPRNLADGSLNPAFTKDYVTFAQTFTNMIRRMQLSVQPKVGITLSGDQSPDSWDIQVLKQCAAQGYGPDAIIDHPYASLYGGPGTQYDRTDYNLLHNTSTDPAYLSWSNWVNRADFFRTTARQAGVPNAANIQLLGTEFGNTGSFPITNQGTNLPNGLWLADTFGQALVAGYTGLNYFPFLSPYDDPGNVTTRTGYNGWNPNDGTGWFYSGLYDPKFYGWRKGAAWGMVGNGTVNASNGPETYPTEVDTTRPGARNFKPATGRGVPLPTFFAEQLFSQFAHTGDTTLTVTDDNADLSVYATRQAADGHLRIMVVNKSATNDMYVNFVLKNFGLNAAAGVTAWRYDIGNDNSQRDSTDGYGWGLSKWKQAPDSFTLTGADSSVPFWFSPYSMTVLDLGPTNANFINNPGFEVNYDPLATNQYIGSPTGWTETGNGYAQSGYGSIPHGGGIYGIHWNSMAYAADSSQQLTNLPNGNYTLSAWVKSSGGQTSASLYVGGSAGIGRSVSLTAATAGGWSGAWTLVVIPDVVVSNGTAKIGFASNAKAGQWLQFDDVVFARNLTVNPGFESGILGWDTWTGTTGTGAGAFTVPTTGGHVSSKYGMHRKTTAYEVESLQVRSDIPNGVYTLTAWVQGSGATTNGQAQVLEVKDYGGAYLAVNIPATTTWTLISIPNIRVTNNRAQFGFYSKVNANQWIKFDDVQFFDPPLADDNNLQIQWDTRRSTNELATPVESLPVSKVVRKYDEITLEPAARVKPATPVSIFPDRQKRPNRGWITPDDDWAQWTSPAAVIEVG